MKSILRFILTVIAAALFWKFVLTSSGCSGFAVRNARAQNYTDAQVDEAESQLSAAITSQLSAQLGIPVICRVHFLAGLRAYERCDLSVATNTIPASAARAMEHEFIVGSCEDQNRRKALDGGVVWKFEVYDKTGLRFASATASRSACSR